MQTYQKALNNTRQVFMLSVGLIFSQLSSVY